MPLDDWDIHREDGKLVGATLVVDDCLLATIGRNEHPDNPWVWEIEPLGPEGKSKSLASATALAERELRAQGTLPPLETRTANVPACGHPDCLDLMGCSVEAAIKNGWKLPEVDTYIPGARIALARISNTGMQFRRDWIWTPAP